MRGVRGGCELGVCEGCESREGCVRDVRGLCEGCVRRV